MFGRVRSLAWAIGPLALGLIVLLVAQMGFFSRNPTTELLAPVFVLLLGVSSLCSLVLSTVAVFEGGARRNSGLIGLACNGLVAGLLLLASGILQ
jgi:hypothetical protein